MFDTIPIPNIPSHVVKKISPDDKLNFMSNGSIPKTSIPHIHEMKQNDIPNTSEHHNNVESSTDISLDTGKLIAKADILKREDNVDKPIALDIQKQTPIDSKDGNSNVITDDINDDSASVLVIILQCESKSCDNNIVNLKWVFSDPYFTVQVCAVDSPPNVPVSKTITQAQYQENYCMRKALTYAAEGPYITNSQGVIEAQFWWSKIPVIIVKDSSVSNITPTGKTDIACSTRSSSGTLDMTNVDHKKNHDDNIIGGMKRRIKVALNKARQADLFYLCKWYDACDKYVDVTGVGNIDHSSTLKWSVQPTSTQAIMYTPSSRDHVRESLVGATVPLSDFLNNNIAQGNLLATVFVPNIIDFDIDLATSNNDYAKLNECAPVTTDSDTTSSAASFIWFALIVTLVIIVAWALIQLGPHYINVPGAND